MPSNIEVERLYTAKLTKKQLIEAIRNYLVINNLVAATTPITLGPLPASLTDATDDTVVMTASYTA